MLELVITCPSPQILFVPFFLFVFFTFQLKLIGFFLRSATVSFFAHLTMWSTNQLKTFGSQNLTEHPFTLILFHFFFKSLSSVLITEQEMPNFSFPKLPKGLSPPYHVFISKWQVNVFRVPLWPNGLMLQMNLVVEHLKEGLLSYLVRSGWVHGDGLTLDLSLFAFL